MIAVLCASKRGCMLKVKNTGIPAKIGSLVEALHCAVGGSGSPLPAVHTGVATCSYGMVTTFPRRFGGQSCLGLTMS